MELSDTEEAAWTLVGVCEKNFNFFVKKFGQFKKSSYLCIIKKGRNKHTNNNNTLKHNKL